jgi:tyrosine-protein kinase Etk/Wzc
MHEENTLSPMMKSKSPANEEILNLRKIFTIFFSHKYLFIGSVVVILALAYLYNRYTIPVYRVGAAILIEDDKKTASTGNDQLMEGFGLMPGMKNFDNQMMVLSSRTLISKILDELALDIEFYNKGLINKKSLYPVQPINIITDGGARLPEDVVFSIKYRGGGIFRLKTESGSSFKLDKMISFGDKIDYPGCTFRLEGNDSGWFADKNQKTLYFTLHSRRSLVESYVKRLKIDRASKQGSIVKLSLEGTNKAEDLAFLSKLSDIFLNLSLDRKNNEAIRTIQFIDDQLAGISDSLLITENKLQQFRSRNKVMNLSAQGQVIINQAMSLENEKARLGLEANYYDYLKGYLEKDAAGEVPIAPATMGISDPGLTKLVADLAEQQSRLYSKSMGEKNPLQSQFSQKVMATKEALKETLKGLSRANSLAIKENQDQINSLNSQATALPRTERQLLGIERKYKLNDELYTFLLEKRAVAQMQKASNVADNEMVDYPEYENKPVKPKKAIIYLFALMTGIGFPFLWLFFTDLLNIRIRTMDEVTKITNIPILGHIPRILHKKYTVIFDDPGSPVSEAFRLLRSRMVFFTKETVSPVILITSSMPDEGKTFTAVNLASAYSLMGKKTILLGFDLRKPKIYMDFDHNNKKGISTWLIGKNSLDDIIVKTKFENLDIITSGPIPPNPAELTSLEKTDELLKLLKGRYDCIIIDSSPLGTVSDTYHLISLSDTCIMVIRQNLTFKDLLESTVNDLINSKTRNLCLVINDINTDDRRYGYGIKYGYTYNNNKKTKKVKKTELRIPGLKVKIDGLMKDLKS